MGSRQIYFPDDMTDRLNKEENISKLVQEFFRERWRNKDASLNNELDNKKAEFDRIQKEIEEIMKMKEIESKRIEKEISEIEGQQEISKKIEENKEKKLLSDIQYLNRNFEAYAGFELTKELYLEFKERRNNGENITIDEFALEKREELAKPIIKDGIKEIL